MTTSPLAHPNPYRCGLCRQPGHDRRHCPCTTDEATRLREEYNRERRQEAAQRRRELNEGLSRGVVSHSEEWRASVYAQVVDMQRRLEELTGARSVAPVRSGPTVREQKVQEILFEHCQEIPEGIYKELMDALVLRD